MSIDEEMSRLREAKDVSFTLAGIVYCVRVLTLEDVLPSINREAQTADDIARFQSTRL